MIKPTSFLELNSFGLRLKSILPVVFIPSISLLYSGHSPSQSLILASPSIIICVTVFCFFLIEQLKNINVRIYLFICIALGVFSASISIVDIGALIFVCGGMLLATAFKQFPRSFFFQFFVYFCIELTIRFITSYFDSFGIYTFKGTYLFYFDSNFVGLILAAGLIGLLDSGIRLNDMRVISVFVLILLTFSRTALILVFVFLTCQRYPRLSIPSIATALLIYPIIKLSSIDLSVLDGSLWTKYLIFDSLWSVVTQNPTALIFGLGRDVDMSQFSSLNTAGYAGHTIWGQVVSFGIIFVSIYYYIFYTFLKFLGVNAGSIFSAYLVTGFIGLSALNYFGIFLIVFAAMQARKVSCFASKNSNRYST